MKKSRPIPNLSPAAREEAISELQDLAKRLGNAAHSIMQKAVQLSSENREDHEKAVRSMRRYRGNGQPEHAAILEIESAVTGLTINECLVCTQTQSGHANLWRRPEPVGDLLEHEAELVRAFRQGTSAQRAAILGTLREAEADRRAQVEERDRIIADLERRQAERIGGRVQQSVPMRASLTVIDGGQQ